MLTRILLILTLLNITLTSGQTDLYIGDNSYVYCNDVELTVTKGIRMETTTSNIYLRGDAQLMQIDDVKNSDVGELSIYQEQNTNIYGFNYWCSPVGVSADGTTEANVNFNGANNIHDPANDADLTNVTSTPYSFTAALDGTATELSSSWMYTFISGDGYYGWNKISNTLDVSPGYGFTLKGSPNANNTLDFRGRPNNGTITVNCYFDGTDADPSQGSATQVSTLTGNPYPSTLDVKKFIIANTSVADGGTAANNIITGEIHYWEQESGTSHALRAYVGGYGKYIPGPLGDLNDNGTYTNATFQTYNGDGTVNTSGLGTGTASSGTNDRRFAAIGQGFVITSFDNGIIPTPGSGIVTFNNGMRVYKTESSTDAIFAKNSSSKKASSTDNNAKISETATIVPEIKIHTHLSNTFYKENIIAFRESTPNNYTYNRFYDATNTSELNTDVYMLSENIELSIKSIHYNEDVTIPFGVKLEGLNPSISVKVYSLNHVPENVPVYLYDNIAGTYTDIINGSFDLNLEAGVYNDRFSIAFKDLNQETLSVNKNVSNSIKVYQNNTLSELNIHPPKDLDIKSISLYDISGKHVLEDNNVSEQEGEIVYSTKHLSQGVYVVSLTTNNNETFTKKVMISNN